MEQHAPAIAETGGPTGTEDAPPLRTASRTAGHDAVHGSFRASPSDPHVAPREMLLGNATHPRGPAVRTLEGRPADADHLHREVTEQLWSRGMAVVQLDQPLPHHRFTALGEFLGTAIPETDPAVQPYVQEGIVLNLRSEHAPTANVSLQPFARNSLSLHSESSGAAVAKQPRYIVLMCVAPGDDTDHARTVLVPMREVARRLPAGTLELLSRTRYRDSPEAPPIARRVDGHWVFSFRDFLDQELRWTHDRPGTDPETVNAALRELLAAMYAPGEAVGVRWRSGLLVVIDNTYHFHGRTAGAAAPPRQQRHLQRLRIR
ncbi:TauD/TfdA family dioxygenase [Streptomyces sp. TG1A-8]|uniref:TauD/TfdA family dioxygenase n=1 Tax=Streptomyces sp. TG1A-8 TaxID=3051385 RepID=UPI00265B9700|nr:TauD/TfdA family dioxygenase [Streptomyces sp. TG1A-8]MDO0928868.1 TauD/TfdA family dioxygenase [Streptomyces sp. TG1A-8]